MELIKHDVVYHSASDMSVPYLQILLANNGLSKSEQVYVLTELQLQKMLIEWENLPFLKDNVKFIQSITKQ